MPDVRTGKPGIRLRRAQSLLSSPIKLAVIIRSYVNQGGCGLTQCSRAHVTASKRENIGTLPTSSTLVPSPQYQWETLKLTPGKHVRGRGCLTEERVRLAVASHLVSDETWERRQPWSKKALRLTGSSEARPVHLRRSAHPLPRHQPTRPAARRARYPVADDAGARPRRDDVPRNRPTHRPACPDHGSRLRHRWRSDHRPSRIPRVARRLVRPVEFGCVKPDLGGTAILITMCLNYMLESSCQSLVMRHLGELWRS